MMFIFILCMLNHGSQCFCISSFAPLDSSPGLRSPIRISIGEIPVDPMHEKGGTTATFTHRIGFLRCARIVHTLR